MLDFISVNLNAEVSIGSVNFTFFNRIVLKNLYIEDQAGDTLIYARKVSANITRFNPKLKKITIGQVNFQQAFINLYIDSTKTINIKFLADRFSKKRTGEKAPWDIEFKNVELADSRFYLKTADNKGPGKNNDGINFSDLKLFNLNIDAKRFKPHGDTLSFIINSLNFNDQSGFVLSSFNARTSICKSHFLFEEVAFRTPYSSVNGEKINLYFTNYSDFNAKTVFDKIKLDIDLNKSNVNFTDLAYFVPLFSKTYQDISFTGRVKGTINNFTGKDIHLEFGKQSELVGEFSLNGLPVIRETFIYAKLKNLHTNYEDLREFILPGNRKFTIPEMIRKMDRLTYKGEFTGFINDFVAYGSLKSNLGLIKTDLLFKPDKENKILFNGSLQSEDYQLGSLFENQDIGNISMKINANGWIASRKTVFASLNGTISNFEYKLYKYNNISLTGVIQDKKYTGEVAVNDPNLSFAFNGLIDFSKETARYDFLASVAKANLYALNIDKSDKKQTVSFDIRAKARGNTLNELTGEIKLINSLFTKKDRQIQIYDIDIVASDTLGEKRIDLKSDFLDASLTGNYEIDKIGSSFQKFLYTYLPALVDSSEAGIIVDLKNSFKFNVVFKNSKPIFDFFFPDYLIADQTRLEGEYEPDSSRLFIFAQSPLLTAKGNSWENVYINIMSDDSILTLNSGSENLMIQDKISLENFTIHSNTESDKITLLLRWNNWDSTLYRGSIKASLSFGKGAGSKSPSMLVSLLPTKVITYDTLWNINAGSIHITKNDLEFSDILINHGEQFFKIYGKISENPNDQLFAEFHDFNLGNINTFISSSGFDIKGILNGEATVSNVFENPLFYAGLAVDSLIINNETLGYTYVNSQWKNSSKSVVLDAYAKRGLLKTLSLKGEYFPLDGGKLNFDLELNKLRLNIFDPYVRKIAKDLKGLASGSLKVEGSLKQPVVNGEIMVQKATFMINYLQTQYYFTNAIRIVKNNALLDHIIVTDQFGNQADVNGVVSNNYLRNFKFNFTINAENFHFLNTTQSDNNQFYGTAFATGIIKITGRPKNITIDITAKTERNTRFFIPLSSSEQISEYNFVSLTLPGESEDDKTQEEKYKVDLSGIQMNFDLEVTPDAQVQMIFDPTVGDILEGRGYGNLKLQINTLGKFNMYGNYVVEEGDYLFTMLNLFNRKFNIDYGGTISWNGSPLDAIINLTAIYRTKSSLSSLFGPAEEYKSKTTVDCVIKMTDKLMNPTIRYDINLPYSDEITKEKVKNTINTSDELIKQFSSLLVMNSFMPENRTGSADLMTQSPYSNVASSNASELLSNQLSNWLSQINNNLDIGVNYRTDRQLKSDEVELALSMLMFNDRLTVYGNVDVPTNATKNTASNVVGDVDLDYKITKNGKIRVKAFNHSNENMLNVPYTQGFGFVFKEEFNTFGELMKRYWLALTGDNKKKKPIDISN